MTISQHIPDFTGRTVVSSVFSTEVELISASAVPNCGCHMRAKHRPWKGRVEQETHDVAAAGPASQRLLEYVILKSSVHFEAAYPSHDVANTATPLTLFFRAAVVVAVALPYYVTEPHLSHKSTHTHTHTHIHPPCSAHSVQDLSLADNSAPGIWPPLLPSL